MINTQLKNKLYLAFEIKKKKVLSGVLDTTKFSLLTETKTKQEGSIFLSSTNNDNW